MIDEVVYHGSSVENLKTIVPHKSTHGVYVYASYDKEVAVVFTKNCGNDLTYSMGRNGQTGPWLLVERVPGAFEVMFNNSSSLYTLSGKSFKKINSNFDEVVSTEEVPVLREEKISNVYIAIKELENLGKIKLIPFDRDNEFIQNSIKNMLRHYVDSFHKSNKVLDKSDFEDILFLHPDLLESINSYLLNYDINSCVFRKENLITILQKKLVFMITGVRREPFLKIGIEEILTFYPELKEDVEQLSEMKNFSKKELIKVLLDLCFLDNNDISEELKRDFYTRYLEDERNIELISKDIYNYFKELKKLNSTKVASLK